MQSFSTDLFNAFLIVVLIWFIVLAITLFTLSRRKDIFASVKYLWAAIIVFAPVAGLLVYLIYGPKKRV